MYVCICNNVTERDIQDAIENGASSVRDLNRQLCVGNQCGKCTCEARKLLKTESVSPLIQTKSA